MIRAIKNILIIIIIAIFLICAASFLSYIKFETANALSSGVGLAKILFTDIDYVEIQESPRVILAQPENSLELLLGMMQDDGYTYLVDESMGSMHVFEKRGVRERIFFSVNRHFSKWIWEE